MWQRLWGRSSASGCAAAEADRLSVRRRIGFDQVARRCRSQRAARGFGRLVVVVVGRVAVVVRPGDLAAPAFFAGTFFAGTFFAAALRVAAVVATVLRATAFFAAGFLTACFFPGLGLSLAGKTGATER
jgi:hypothetical protein